MKKTIQALREKQPEIRNELATEMAQGTEDDTSPDTSTEESCVYVLRYENHAELQ